MPVLANFDNLAWGISMRSGVDPPGLVIVLSVSDEVSDEWDSVRPWSAGIEVGTLATPSSSNSGSLHLMTSSGCTCSRKPLPRAWISVWPEKAVHWELQNVKPRRSETTKTICGLEFASARYLASEAAVSCWRAEFSSAVCCSWKSILVPIQ